MNCNVEGNGITSPMDATQLVSQVQFNGMTPLGTALDSKVASCLRIMAAEVALDDHSLQDITGKRLHRAACCHDSKEHRLPCAADCPCARAKQLVAQVIRPFFASQVQNRTLKKPVLCIVITDGAPWILLLQHEPACWSDAHKATYCR